MEEMIFGIVVTAILMLIGLYNLLIAILGLFDRFKAMAVGTLLKKRSRRNVRTKGGFIIPVVTDYTYEYKVNGKKYRYSSSGRFTKAHLYKNVTMVYVKWFPRYAYPEKFTATNQWLIGISMFVMAVLFTVAIVCA